MAAGVERERGDRPSQTKPAPVQRGDDRGISGEQKLDRILERLERMEQRLERLERGK